MGEKIDKVAHKIEWKKVYSDHKNDIILVTIFILIIIYVGFSILIRQVSYKDLENNLIAGAVDILIASALIPFLVVIREKWKWNSVKDTVYESLGDEISNIFTDITNFCKIDVKGNLNFYPTEDGNLLNGGYGELFIIRKNNIGDIEHKYFKFLEPSIIVSLLKIQKYLNSLDLNIRIRNRNIELNSPYTRPDSEILEYVKGKMASIFNEIDNLREEPNLKNHMSEN